MIAGRYVALGSSFAAGPGIPPVDDRKAGRSRRNYPHLVAQRLNLDLVDVTFSGARTEHVLAKRQRGASPQIDAVEADTGLVTITVGGNDVGYIGSMIGSALRGTIGRRLAFLPSRFTNPTYGGDTEERGRRLDRTRRRLVQIVDAVCQRSNARILLVDYLTVIGPEASPGRYLPLSEDQIAAYREVAALLAETFTAAANESGAKLVSASSASVDHGVGAAEPWMTGFQWGNPFGDGLIPFHPNAEGMAAVAELVVRGLAL
jgi:lysophospholipase L1-like esterase